MRNISYVVIDDCSNSNKTLRNLADMNPALTYLGTAESNEEALNLILKCRPDLVFIEINSENPLCKLSLNLINELQSYLFTMPKFVVTTNTEKYALKAIRMQVFDYLLKPLDSLDFQRCISKLEKNLHFPDKSDYHELLALKLDKLEDSDANSRNNGDASDAVTAGLFEERRPLVICVKSYGDYRFINASEIFYLKADNNSTDIHLKTGDVITAYKTLKHFEQVLDSPFLRIHNSYIVNIDYVSRIHSGNSSCFIKNSTIKIPFSKTYRSNIEAIIKTMSQGNYIEI
ncbi:MAG: LytR/AlgR family response regulator transcription factor [Flavobacterium sp.]